MDRGEYKTWGSIEMRTAARGLAGQNLISATGTWISNAKRDEIVDVFLINGITARQVFDALAAKSEPAAAIEPLPRVYPSIHTLEPATPAPIQAPAPIAPIADPSAAMGDLQRALLALVPKQQLDESRVLALIAEQLDLVVSDAVKTAIETATLPRIVTYTGFGAEPHTIAGAAPILDSILAALATLKQDGEPLVPWIWGPAGTGKTTLARHAGKALGLQFRFQAISAQATAASLLGFVDAMGRAVRTPFREAYECGGLFLLDEADASESVLLALNGAIENGFASFPDATVARHNDFRCVCAANTNGLGSCNGYKRAQLDAATLDRFVFFEVRHCDKKERELAGPIATLIQAIRADVDHTLPQLKGRITMRASIQAEALVRSGMDLKPAIFASALKLAEPARAEEVFARALAKCPGLNLSIVPAKSAVA